MFDWVKVVAAPVKNAELEMDDDGNDRWMEEHMRKEERLIRMKNWRDQWEVEHI